MSESKNQRTIKLHCPLASKSVNMAVWDCERIDLGSIGRAFGLDPQSVKLNRHFIARGIGHVASSVTWKSLLSCFSSKRLSGAIVVEGQLCRVGTKRAVDLCEESSNIESINKRIKEGGEGFKLDKGLGFKRKQIFVDGLSLLKKLRINETCTDITANDQNGVSKTISRLSLRCSTVGSIIRTRETESDDEITTITYKKFV